METGIKVGSLVGWNNPNPSEGEENDVMRVLEVNGERALVEHQNTGMQIKPTRVVLVAELEAKS